MTSSVCRSPTRRVRTFVVHGKRGAAAQVHGRNREGLVHRHEEVAGAKDAALVAKSAIEGLAESDAHIFNRVMLIDVEVAIALEFEIEGAVTREEFEHVIEEANARRDFVLTTAFDREFDSDACFRGVASQT